MRHNLRQVELQVGPDLPGLGCSQLGVETNILELQDNLGTLFGELDHSIDSLQILFSTSSLHLLELLLEHLHLRHDGSLALLRSSIIRLTTAATGDMIKSPPHRPRVEVAPVPLVGVAAAHAARGAPTPVVKSIVFVLPVKF